MDLHTTLPDFPTRPYGHILPSLEKAKISVKELLISDALEIAKQAKVPVTDVRGLATQILAALHKDLGLGVSEGDAEGHGQGTKDLGNNACASESPEIPDKLSLPKLSTISTLDPVLDAALGGGISTGYVTEISGESGSGKTQFLLHLLFAVQLPPPHGSSKKALYVSTEADLPTGRLSQLLEEHPHLSTLPADSRPSLENILSITTVDLETQDHVLNYQIPVAVSRYNIGLVVIDSITANYRAESSTEDVPSLLARAWQLKRLGHFLRTLAVKENIAIVAANQVSDRFNTLNESIWTEELEQPPSSYLQEQQNQASSSQPSSSWHQGSQSVEIRQAALDAFRSSHLAPEFSSSPPVSYVPSPEDAPGDNAIAIDIPELSTVLGLEYQQPFLDGWGGSHASAMEVTFSGGRGGWKAPALGLVWTNQVGCRIVLKVENVLVQDSLPTPRRIAARQPPRNTALHSNQSAASEDGGHLLLHSGLAAGNAELELPDLKEPTKPDMRNAEEPSNARARSPLQSNQDRSPTASPERRRKRTMQVVFSPWTSGDPQVSLEKDGDRYETVTDDGIEFVEFDPTLESVEFEIFSGGIRGVQV